MEKHVTALQIAHLLGEEFSREWIHALIEVPKKDSFGDLAFPCFQLAKTFRKSPQSIAEELASKINHPHISKAEAKGGYVNLFLDQDFFTSHTLKEVLSNGENYGAHTIGEGKTVVLDLSSPNIAKPFSMGHLRSTIIGNTISHLAEKCGYETVKINYVGDYGTQFGKLVAAYTHWGDDQAIKEDPLTELTRIYVKFHEEAETNPSLIDEGRSYFKKLEDGDEEVVALWSWFKDVSLVEFDRIYDLLGVEFDLTRGEAYYNDKMDPIIEDIKQKGWLEESDGAQVVRLDEEGLPPCLVRKSNGTTTYATRDLAAAVDRYNTYSFSEALYLVGHEQTLHFQQVKHVLDKMDLPWAANMHHVPFGMILKDGKKMSTRAGKTVLLEEVLQEAIERAGANIAEKNPGLEERDQVARQVGVGAVIFHDLKHNRTNDVEFSLDEMLSFEGHTGPYVQYTHVRTLSLLKKAGFELEHAEVELSDEQAWGVVKHVRSFPHVIQESYQAYDPSKLAKYLLDLAKSFNQYYAHTQVLGSDQEKGRLTLIYAVQVILNEGLSLLGIEAPENM
ncbi:arginine--tRNA ligase [Halobacillus litoralis]|uniref:arginine--tRNA ligase n=1 Tax=Halobacillus litoralis TaxID=45668 RepID=UPI001CD1C471|nr:arginine--tRNA ligase [Halobacillus litoralis]MCA0971978.1 arginine--tRNA ligase [Halobacillus litoralis]